MADKSEDTDLAVEDAPEVVREEVEEILAELGAGDDPDAIDELARDLLDDLGSRGEGEAFGLMLVDELRRRAEKLRHRPQ